MKIPEIPLRILPTIPHLSNRQAYLAISPTTNPLRDHEAWARNVLETIPSPRLDDALHHRSEHEEEYVYYRELVDEGETLWSRACFRLVKEHDDNWPVGERKVMRRFDTEPSVVRSISTFLQLTANIRSIYMDDQVIADVLCAVVGVITVEYGKELAIEWCQFVLVDLFLKKVKEMDVTGLGENKRKRTTDREKDEHLGPDTTPRTTLTTKMDRSVKRVRRQLDDITTLLKHDETTTVSVAKTLMTTTTTTTMKRSTKGNRFRKAKKIGDWSPLEQVALKHNRNHNHMLQPVPFTGINVEAEDDVDELNPDSRKAQQPWQVTQVSSDRLPPSLLATIASARLIPVFQVIDFHYFRPRKLSAAPGNRWEHWEIGLFLVDPNGEKTDKLGLGIGFGKTTSRLTAENAAVKNATSKVANGLPDWLYCEGTKRSENVNLSAASITKPRNGTGKIA